MANSKGVSPRGMTSDQESTYGQFTNQCFFPARQQGMSLGTRQQDVSDDALESMSISTL